MNRNELPDAYVMMYSVIDKTSFKTAEDELARLQNWDALRSRALILVGNKIDLVRSRAVSTQGIKIPPKSKKKEPTHQLTNIKPTLHMSGLLVCLQFSDRTAICQ